MDEKALNRLGLKIGGRYRNRINSYEIIELKGENILVRNDDGTTQLLDAKIAARIYVNIGIEEKRAIPEGMEEIKWAYALGCIAAVGRLEAEVPPQAVDGFLSSYFEATGEQITKDTEGFFPITVGGYNKWGSELRIYFPAFLADDKLFLLPSGVNIVAGIAPDTVRINNNTFWWFLVERNGLRIGSKQKIDRIRSSIPKDLWELFNAGARCKRL